MNNVIFILVLILANLLPAQTFYNWPCVPFDQQHYINGTFCENRPSGSISIHHFHDGVDIHLPQGNNVYSVINGSITSLGYASTYGINAYVRVGRYAYVHVDPSPSIQVGSSVIALQTVVGHTNSWNHIHFKDGYVNSEINALRANGGLSPMSDTYPPYIDAVNYYINGTTTHFANNRVSGLVEIVAKARDKTDNGSLGNNNGIHTIGYQIYDESGTTSLTDSIQNINFTQIPPSDSYVTNVFFTGSDISNYYYTITNPITRDGFWDTREFESGTYKVKVFTDDSKLNSKEYWSTVEVVVQDIYPPADPELADLIGDDQNQWKLRWLQNDSSDVAGYELYFSYDGTYWIYQESISEQLQAGDTSFTWENFGNGETIYFKLQTYDQAAIPNFSGNSDAYGIRLSSQGPQVLVVDAFDRTDGYWTKSAHQFNPVYGNILADLNLAFNSSSDEALLANITDILEYQNVIYFLGDESGTSPALSAPEQEMIREYLERGGNLLICGSEIGYDLIINGTVVDSLFYAEYLKAKLISDSSGSLIIEGEESSIFADIIAEIEPPEGNTLRPDVIELNGGSTPILKFADGTVAGIHFQGTFNQSANESNMVYLTFPLELVKESDARRLLLQRIFELFGVNTDVIARQQYETVTGFHLYDNYPNPFNPETKIRFRLPVSDWVKLAIFSIEGRHVKTIKNHKLDAGSYEFSWDGSDDNGQQVSSGIYVYRLQTTGFQQSKKMILIR